MDRGASLAWLERRFGNSLAESRAEREVFGRTSPEVREVVRDLHALERGELIRQDHGHAVQHVGDAIRLRDLNRWMRERTESIARAFDMALGDVYRDPVTREGFEVLARQRGAESAAPVIRERPE